MCNNLKRFLRFFLNGRDIGCKFCITYGIKQLFDTIDFSFFKFNKKVDPYNF